MHALLIDDSRAIRCMIKSILIKIGFDVSEASNGREGLDVLKERGKPDLVLVDWNMPVMNGLEFIVAVRGDSDYDDMLMMMVTTESGIDRMIEALEAGANEYLMKPFTRDTLQEKIEMLGVLPS